VKKSSIYEAKAHFSEIVERAEAGLVTVITKRGRAVAKIVPAGEPKWDRTRVLDEADALRREIEEGGTFRVADLLEEGRM
jgi:prevent-host-death family protein